MAKRRMIDTRFWSDNFIADLNPLDRYLFLYFLTNEHTNISGIYEVPLKRISDETGIEKEMLLRMIKRLKGKIAYIKGWVAIRNFSKYQSDNEKVRIGVKNAKALIPKHILDKIDRVWIDYDRVSIESDIPELESESKLEPETTAQSAGVLIGEIIKLFEEVDPKNKTYYGNKNQRKACDFLLKEYGLEEVRKRISFLPRSNKLPYFPTITTPVQLRDKWVQLHDAVERKRGENKNKMQEVI